MAKTVWICGAGFSAPLDAPLLTTLLSPQSLWIARKLFSGPEYKHLSQEIYETVTHIYGYGSLYRAGRNRAWTPDPESLWGNAEEFLEHCDRAARGGPSTPSFERIARSVNVTGGIPFAKKEDAERLADAARRLVAA